jgi:hypothetical protein
MAGWSQSGNNLTTTDNVGIGTTSPQSTLHANGVLTISQGTGGDSRAVFGAGPDGTSLISSRVVPPGGPGPHSNVFTNGSALGFWTFPTVSKIQQIGTPAAAPVQRVAIDETGNVGVGTPTPLVSLDVRGQASFQGALSLNHAGVAGIGSPGDKRAAITFGTVDTSTAFFLGPYDGNAPKASAVLALYSYQFGNFIQFWAPNGNVGIGTVEPASKLHVVGDVTVTGDVLLTGADCAEQFDVSASETLEAGTVVVIDTDGSLRQSSEPYDGKVAGVVSGAGAYRHALVLDQRPSDEGRVPVALIGKVYCKVDATHSPIKVGDLLTTSSTPGHAMKATDPAKAFGAVIGKALAALSTGVGLIPILIALQ